MVSIMNTFETLKRLTDADGVSGDEGSAASVILNLLDEMKCGSKAALDCHGSVAGYIGEYNEDNPTVMLDAHIDRIGLIVTYIAVAPKAEGGGFVKAEACGGIDRRLLPAQPVTIHTRTGKKVKGVICTKPPHVQKDGEGGKAIKGDSIIIDVGFAEGIELGDTVTVDGGLTKLLNNKVSGSALDNRAGVCAVLYAIELLKHSPCRNSVNVAVSFSVQEEVGCRGAAVTAYNIDPSVAVVVDVSYGLSPDCYDVKHKCGELGKGPMIGYAPVLNREIFGILKKTAAERKIPYQTEIINGDTGGTNADKITVVKGGIKTALVSIPLRYMHTTVETADLSDIEAVGRLIAVYTESLRGGRVS